MIRTTDSGTYLWFPCVGRYDRKISWTHEQYLACAKVSESEPEMRRRLYGLGVISELTEEDKRELGHGGMTDRRAKARAKAAGR